MSIHIPVPPTEDIVDGDSSSESSQEEEEETWDDWVSDSAKQPCLSLFDATTFPTAEDAIAHDKSAHAFDLSETCTKLGEFIVRYTTN